MKTQVKENRTVTYNKLVSKLTNDLMVRMGYDSDKAVEQAQMIAGMYQNAFVWTPGH